MTIQAGFCFGDARKGTIFSEIMAGFTVACFLYMQGMIKIKGLLVFGIQQLGKQQPAG